MARQIGKHQISGTLGNLTFYKSQHGMLVRKKTSLDAKRVAKDPCFKRTRENAGEFKKAIRAGQVLRTALHPVLPEVADNAVTARMNGLFLKILRQDEIHARGERLVSAGQISLAEGFEMNRDASLRDTLRIAYKTSIDYTTGQMQVTIPAFVPGQDLIFPEGATHCRFVMAGAAVDFDKETFDKAYQQSDYVALHSIQFTHEPISLHCKIAVNPGEALWLTLGVLFYQLNKNGEYRSMAENSMSVVAIGKGQQALPGRAANKQVKKALLFKKAKIIVPVPAPENRPAFNNKKQMIRRSKALALERR